MALCVALATLFDDAGTGVEKTNCLAPGVETIHVRDDRLIGIYPYPDSRRVVIATHTPGKGWRSREGGRFWARVVVYPTVERDAEEMTLTEDWRRLGVNGRVVHTLARAGVTVDAAARMSDDALLEVRNLGVGALGEVRRAIGRAPDESPAWMVIA